MRVAQSDSKANDFIAHWLDRFGAPGARVVARGERTGQQLIVVFPYAEGAFRDTFPLNTQALHARLRVIGV
jgi:hypothetical protein